MSGMSPCPRPPLESTEAALQNIKVHGLVIRIHTEHLALLESVADEQARMIAAMKTQLQNAPHMANDFTRSMMGPRDIIVYGAVENLPANNHALAQKYLSAGRRVSFVTAMTPTQVRSQMSMEENGTFGHIYMDSLQVKLSESPQFDNPHHIFEMLDKRRVCEIPYTAQFGEVTRAATHNLMGHATKLPCDNCVCPRKGPSPL